MEHFISFVRNSYRDTSIKHLKTAISTSCTCLEDANQEVSCICTMILLSTDYSCAFDCLKVAWTTVGQSVRKMNESIMIFVDRLVVASFESSSFVWIMNNFLHAYSRKNCWEKLRIYLRNSFSLCNTSSHIFNNFLMLIKTTVSCLSSIINATKRIPNAPPIACIVYLYRWWFSHLLRKNILSWKPWGNQACFLVLWL